MEASLSQIKTASLFGAFTTPSKLAVIKALFSGPVHVAGISELTNLDQPIVSQLLTQLRALGIVSFEKIGSRNYYQLEPTGKIRELIEIAEALAA